MLHKTSHVRSFVSDPPTLIPRICKHQQLGDLTFLEIGWNWWHSQLVRLWQMPLQSSHRVAVLLFMQRSDKFLVQSSYLLPWQLRDPQHCKFFGGLRPRLPNESNGKFTWKYYKRNSDEDGSKETSNGVESCWSMTLGIHQVERRLEEINCMGRERYSN